MNIFRSKRVQFDQLGIFMLMTIPMIVAGFTPRYIYPLATGMMGFNFLTHLHATCMTLWILLVTVQPFLIRRGKRKIHRFVGRISYVLAPMVLLSIILLAHQQIGLRAEMGFYFLPGFWFMEGILFTVFYLLAMYNRKNAAYHARFIVAGLPIVLETPLFRFIGIFIGLGPQCIVPTFVCVDAVLLALAFKDRHATQGRRWVFPGALAAYVAAQTLIVTGTNTDAWKNFVHWLAGL
jgi:uncharacterized membrane protein SirB2